MINYNGLSKMKDVKDSVSLETLAVKSVYAIWFATVFKAIYLFWIIWSKEKEYVLVISVWFVTA